MGQTRFHLNYLLETMSRRLNIRNGRRFGIVSNRRRVRTHRTRCPYAALPASNQNPATAIFRFLRLNLSTRDAIDMARIYAIAAVYGDF